MTLYSECIRHIRSSVCEVARTKQETSGSCCLTLSVKVSVVDSVS